MAMTTAEVLDWQRRMSELPRVYTVLIENEPNGVYDSMEAAEWVARWDRRNGSRSARAVCIGHVLNLELAREQYPTPPAPPKETTCE